MSNHAAVHSVDALKDFRVALALFGEDVLSALGAVDLEARRTLQWLQHDRKMYWQDQIKRRHEQVALAKSDLFRKKLAKTADYTPSMSEQKEALRKAEAGLMDAEMRAAASKKWETALQQAVFEYHGSVRRIKDLAGGDVPRAVFKLERMIDALESYLRTAPPSGIGPATGAGSVIETVAGSIVDEEPVPADPAPGEPDEAAPRDVPADADAPGPPA